MSLNLISEICSLVKEFTLNTQIVNPHEGIDLVVADRDKNNESCHNCINEQSERVVEGNFDQYSGVKRDKEVTGVIEEGLCSSLAAQKDPHVTNEEKTN